MPEDAANASGYEHRSEEDPLDDLQEEQLEVTPGISMAQSTIRDKTLAPETEYAEELPAELPQEASYLSPREE